jgi:O-antigen/teichoic acid export membrane protein
MVKKFSLPVLGKKIAFSTIVQVAGKFTHIFLSAITLKLVSNYLGQQGYGVYATIAEYSMFFSVAANLGIFGNTVRMMADDPKNGKVFINTLVLRVVTAGLFYFAAVFYAVTSGMGEVFVLGALLYGGSLFLDYITSVCDGSLQANYRMGRATLALLAGKLLNFGIILAFTLNYFTFFDEGFRSAGIFLAAMSGSVFTALLSVYFVVKSIDWSWKIDSILVKKIFFLSLPFGIINIFNNLYFRFLPDYFARVAMTDAEFASFNVSFRIAQVLSLFSTFLMFSALPGFRQYLDNKDFKGAANVYGKVAAIIAVGGLLLVIFGSLLGPPMLRLLTNKDFFSSDLWFMLPLMLVMAAVSYGYDLVLITLFAFNKEIWFLKNELIALIIAAAIFFSSAIVDDLAIKTFIIIAGSIFGLSFIVLRGIFKIRRLFNLQQPTSFFD